MRWLKSLKLPKPQALKRFAPGLVQVSGLGCLNSAAYWWHPIIGLVVSGLMLCFVGYVIDEADE